MEGLGAHSNSFVCACRVIAFVRASDSIVSQRMFKPKRHHGTIKKAEQGFWYCRCVNLDDGKDSGVKIDLERFHLEEQV